LNFAQIISNKYKLYSNKYFRITLIADYVVLKLLFNSLPFEYYKTHLNKFVHITKVL